ncbi:hypothetical protein FZEAL_5724 [Fusarium zealandicum]|uniref:Rhodopsin domain-containing protein n=1 Tax=Fusarium zealandicum TaxID=1053134 RepID=A0A8H4UK44_9HYPO|nr:hypothetical protein FZEAL_5724 [Fusarium zealandicum]
MDLDPFVISAFGPPPKGMDLAETQRIKAFTIVFVLLIVSALSVAGRLISRIKFGPGLSRDDYAVFAAWMFVAVTAAMVVAVAAAGAGKHVWALRHENLVDTAKLLYIYIFPYALAVVLTKTSILLFYWRVFMGTTALSFRLTFWFSAFLVGSYPIYFLFTMVFCCQPVSYYWTRFAGTEGTCIDVSQFFVILAIINLVTDVILLALPIPEILKLQMSRENKLAICGIVALGGLLTMFPLFSVCIASAVRLHYLIIFESSVDTTWHMGDVAIWSSAEPSVGIISVCLPSFKPFLMHLYGKNTASRGSIGNQAGYALASNSTRSRRNRLDDEIALRSYIVGGEGSLHSASESENRKHIRVRTEVQQTSNY